MIAENAKSGIGKIYKAQIVTIIATIITIAGAIAMVAFGKIVSSDGNVVNIADVVSLVAILVSLVLALIAFFMNVKGISLASKDEPSFKDAMVMLIMGLITSVLAVVFSKTKPSLSKSFESINNIAELFTTYYIIRGCINLAEQRKKDDIVKAGKTATNIIIIVWLIATLLQSAAVFFPSQDKTAIETILSIAALVLAIVSYVIYLRVLNKTSDIL